MDSVMTLAPSGVGGAERTARPELWRSRYVWKTPGSRSETSSRAMSAIDRRGGMFRWVETWPNWRSRSMIATRSGERVARATARLTAIVVVPTPPFGEKTAISRCWFVSRTVMTGAPELLSPMPRERW